MNVCSRWVVFHVIAFVWMSGISIAVRRPAEFGILSSRLSGVNIASCDLRVRADELKGIVNDDATSPGVRPVPESCVIFGSEFKTCRNTLFCFCVICGQEIGEEIEPDPILCGSRSTPIGCCAFSPAVIRCRKIIPSTHLQILKCQLRSMELRFVGASEHRPLCWPASTMRRQIITGSDTLCDIPFIPIPSPYGPIYFAFWARGVSLRRMNSCTIALNSRSAVFTANWSKTNPAPRLDCG